MLAESRIGFHWRWGTGSRTGRRWCRRCWAVGTVEVEGTKALKVVSIILAAVCLGCASQLAWSDAGRLLGLLVGEYNNNEQVWQDGLDGVSAYVRRHWRFARVDGGRIGLAVAQGQSAPAVGWILAFTEDDLGIHSAIAQADGRALSCRYRWRGRNDEFIGMADDAGSCPEPLPAVWQVTPTHLFSTYRGDGGERIHQARRVRRYTGWVALQRRRIDPQAAGDDYVFLKDLRLHDEGFVVSIKDGGQLTGYAVELARLTYQNTRTAVLKLGVIDEATGRTLSYSWAEPGAKRIGINLRWVQAGLTKADD